MAGPLEDLVARIHRRIEAFASEHGLEQAMVEVELADGALLRLESLSAEPGYGFLTLVPHGEERAAGADRPDRGDPSAHAESGRGRRARSDSRCPANDAAARAPARRCRTRRSRRRRRSADCPAATPVPGIVTAHSQVPIAVP